MVMEEFHKVAKTRNYNRLYCKSCRLMQGAHDKTVQFRERHIGHNIIIRTKLKTEE